MGDHGAHSPLTVHAGCRPPLSRSNYLLINMPKINSRRATQKKLSLPNLEMQQLKFLQTGKRNGVRQSKIEDSFEDTLKATVIDGKTFDDQNNFDTDTHYGKKIFAHKVVVQNAKSINFSGFRPLLSNW
jgi:hypothetical protein